MAEVDASIYNNIKTPNPLEMVGNLANLQNVQNQNKLFQQEYNSKLGLSQIYKQAIDPATGQLDTQKLNQLMSDPQASANVSLGLPQAYQNSQEAQQRNLGISSAQVDLAQKHLNGLLTNYLNPLVQMGAGATSKDVATALGQGISSGIADPTSATQIWSQLPRDQQGNVIESQVPAFIKSQQMRVLSAQEQLNATNPAPGAVNTGSQTQFIRTPQIGAPSVAGVINNTLPPTTTSVGPGNVPQYLGQATSQLQVPGQPAAPTAPQGQGSPLAGSMPGLGGNGGPQPNATPAASNTPVQAGLAPGVAEAATVSASDAAHAYQGLKNDVGGSATRIFQLQKALTGLQGAPTGPGTETVNRISSFLQAQSPDALKQYLPGVDPTQIKNRDEADKYLTAFASGAAGSFGPHTDNQLATALSANASTHISNLAAQDVVKANIGLEKMKQAQALAFQASGLPPQQFSDWAVNFNKDTDPRAFIADKLTPSERSTMIKGMKPAEQKKFISSFRNGLNLGIINLSDLNQGK